MLSVAKQSIVDILPEMLRRRILTKVELTKDWKTLAVVHKIILHLELEQLSLLVVVEGSRSDVTWGAY